MVYSALLALVGKTVSVTANTVAYFTHNSQQIIPALLQIFTIHTCSFSQEYSPLTYSVSGFYWAEEMISMMRSNMPKRACFVHSHSSYNAFNIQQKTKNVFHHSHWTQTPHAFIQNKRCFRTGGTTLHVFKIFTKVCTSCNTGTRNYSR